MKALKKNIRNAVLTLPLLLAGIAFFSCHDPIFEDINKESAINEDRIKGGISCFVPYNGHVYVAPANDGVIYRKNLNDVRNRGDWESVRCPKIPIYLAKENGCLYMLATEFDNGSGDYDGINMPTKFYEYKTDDPGNWGDPIDTYKYDTSGTYIPSRYKNQHSKVSTTSGTYSIATNTNELFLGNEMILRADQRDVRAGSWWCLAGTNDQLIIGSSVGLLHMQIGSTDIDDDVAPNEISTSKSVFGGMTILAVYVAGTDMTDGVWQSSTSNEADCVIYAFATGTGSSYASQNGLYSYIPGKGWDSEF